MPSHATVHHPGADPDGPAYALPLLCAVGTFLGGAVMSRVLLGRGGEPRHTTLGMRIDEAATSVTVMAGVFALCVLFATMLTELLTHDVRNPWIRNLPRALVGLGLVGLCQITLWHRASDLAPTLATIAH